MTDLALEKLDVLRSLFPLPPSGLEIIAEIIGILGQGGKPRSAKVYVDGGQIAANWRQENVRASQFRALGHESEKGNVMQHIVC